MEGYAGEEGCEGAVCGYVWEEEKKNIIKHHADLAINISPKCKILTIKTLTTMAKIKTMAGIASISGRVGNYCFRTMRATGKVFMHRLPSKEHKKSVQVPSDAVLAQRKRFGAITKMVAQMRKGGSNKSSKQLWKIATEAYDAANQ